MKKIFLIGDSIRMGAGNGLSLGYGIEIKRELFGKAEVFGSDDNSRFAEYTLRYLREWAAQVPREEIDIVHWNNGLWDVLHLDGDDALTPLDVYIDTMRRIHKKIKLFFPNAKIFFSLITSVKEEWADPDFVRYNREICKYNSALKELMSELEVPVIDLYEVTSAFPDSYRADWVHFNEYGSRILAETIIKNICSDTMY